MSTKKGKTDSEISMYEYIILVIEGGHGKNIMATAVTRAIKKKYPTSKIIIVTAWETPFYYNPDIFRIYSFGQTPYFYDDFVKNNEDKILILRIDPYHTQSHILQLNHLTKTWCEMYDIEWDGVEPIIYLNDRELEIARDKIKPDSKPIMLLQTNGGAPQSQYSKKSWARDMPIGVAQGLVDYFCQKYRILHIRTPEQPELRNTEMLNLPLREIYAVMTLSSKRLFIDSFAQHAAAALNLPSTVCWIANKPEIFGYEMHTNILPNQKEINEFNKYSFLEKFDISGNIHQFPYENVNIFDINEIAQAVEKQK